MTKDEALKPAGFVGEVPRGFEFSAVRAGIKPSGRPDFACVLAAEHSTGAALFTSNRLQAAPVIVGRDHLARSEGRIRMVAVNAGNANCATGPAGIEHCRQVCAAAAASVGCPPELVFPSSTGIIGVPLRADKLIAALPAAHAGFGSSARHLQEFAEAILTTDTRAKIAVASIGEGTSAVRIAGVAKGAGMIAPQLAPHATMLAFLFTDAKIAAANLGPMLKAAVEPTFNCISIDGDTSTNDTVLLLASGAGTVEIDSRRDQQAADDFATALQEVCASLARQIVDDGEGAGHRIALNVTGAATFVDARRVARSIADSPLVKTAFAGCDPNWGRILAAAGYSGVEIDPERISIWIGGLPVCREGRVAEEFDKERVHAAMRNREVEVRIELSSGTAACRFLTCDLTAEYVRVNAEYST